ncbi:ACT domain-containing protein [Amphibacillus cookii]|uniref:ACT domain-containing protein n=1 Tax=Amphibacillus cookii TaxID=767787 RepID=UPI0019598641|nr:ACT domain-containing protein [Amphibacillus cookii]MBM7541769.1 chorismate mutase [Amphibacillus cookii]
MKKEEETFYLVRGDFLPEAMRKTLEVKAQLDRGKANSVYEAVKRVGLSRSAYYKYRDAVFPLQAIQKTRIITLFFHLEDRSGTLSTLLDTVARAGGNILTIHQTIPVHGKANVTLSLDVEQLLLALDELIVQLKNQPFIERVEILSSGA